MVLFRWWITASFVMQLVGVVLIYASFFLKAGCNLEAPGLFVAALVALFGGTVSGLCGIALAMTAVGLKK